MPLYEYFCADCNGIFELLRPVRQAAQPQPCPECDADAKRIMSKDFATFTYRDGYPRRIPDDGSFLHLGQKVARPISRAADSYTHPDLEPVKDTRPSIEDIEQYEAVQVAKQDIPDDPTRHVVTDATRREETIRREMVRTKGTPTQERAKRAALRTEADIRKKKQAKPD